MGGGEGEVAAEVEERGKREVVEVEERGKREVAVGVEER